MAFLGNTNGPRKSSIAAALGPAYFEVTAAQFAEMNERLRRDEERGLVEPWGRDDAGCLFTLWPLPGGRTRRYYPQFHGDARPEEQTDPAFPAGAGTVSAGAAGVGTSATWLIEQRDAPEEQFAPELLRQAEAGVGSYLERARAEGKIDPQQFTTASAAVVSHLRSWAGDPRVHALAPHFRAGLEEAVRAGRWEELVNAFRKRMSFGTGGIRGLMAFDRAAIERLHQEGIDAPILKGPNTFNDIVVLLTSTGVAAFGRKQGFRSIVIGYDSRVRGADFASLIASLFLAFDYLVYLFDAPCPYPEVTFAIPHLHADLGILISASHNDYRYNGYKLSCSNGSQFDPAERDELYNEFIIPATTAGIRLTPLAKAAPGKLVFLGGDRPIPEVNYHGGEFVDLHGAHRRHVESFLVHPGQTANPPVRIGYCAFHGAGRIAVPALFRDAKLGEILPVTENGLNDLNGLFPSFRSDAGKEQQPDPGDPRAAVVAVETFRHQYGAATWQSTDLLVGTDPDADRCGVVVKLPQEERAGFGGEDYCLLSADEMWALLLWYRFKEDPTIVPEESFVALSHTTTDSITRLALRHGAGVVKTWVGFGSLAAGVRDVWEGKIRCDLHEGKTRPDDFVGHPYLYETYGMDGGRRRYNLAALEQSNGFSILGGPPPDKRSLGTKGHVRDKDGTFAALLVGEVAQWAKTRGTTIYELCDEEIHLDPEIGLFVTYYEPDPLDGEYPGIEGDRLKKEALRRVLELGEACRQGSSRIAGVEVKGSVVYRTGKYDHVYPPEPGFAFPDEGVRFYFDAERIQHATVRPSGTTNSLRFHVQLHDSVGRTELRERRRELRRTARSIVSYLRDAMGVQRSEG